MADENPSILNHVSIATNRMEDSLSFYDAVLGTVGAARLVEYPGGVAYGKAFPEFWVQPQPFDGGQAETANGIHFSFNAVSSKQVQDFSMGQLPMAVLMMAHLESRPDYGELYYGCFVKDPDGHKFEATFWDETLAES